MSKIFDMEGPVIRFMNRVADLLILNFLTMFCCIPVITAGAAFTAQHYVVLKWVRNEDGYLVRGFFKSFKQNFKQATLIWLGVLVLAALFAVDFYIFKNSEIEFSKAFTIIFFALLLVCVFAVIYVFPVLARFNNSVKNSVRNALSLAILNPPQTLAMTVIYAAPFVLMYFFDIAWLFAFMFAFSLPAYLSAFLYSGIFKKYEPEAAAAASDYDFSVDTGGENPETDAIVENPEAEAGEETPQTEEMGSVDE